MPHRAGLCCSKMSTETRENFGRFRSLVLSDLSLQARLRDIEDSKEFVAALIGLGAENGCVFTEEDVEWAKSENNQIWIERWI